MSPIFHLHPVRKMHMSILRELKSEKKCNLGKPHCFPKRLKWTFFEFLWSEKGFLKNFDFSLWVIRAATCTHIKYCTIFPILGHDTCLSCPYQNNLTTNIFYLQFSESKSKHFKQHVINLCTALSFLLGYEPCSFISKILENSKHHHF